MTNQDGFMVYSMVSCGIWSHVTENKQKRCNCTQDY